MGKLLFLPCAFLIIKDLILLFILLFNLNKVRDEVKKNDPSLVEFSKLSEHERSQNLQMAQDTLRSAPTRVASLNSAQCFLAFINCDTQKDPVHLQSKVCLMFP